VGIGRWGREHRGWVGAERGGAAGEETGKRPRP
jgi:hypothetical protein